MDGPASSERGPFVSESSFSPFPSPRTAVLADEPTGELDTKTGREILQLFQHLNQELHKTAIVVTHDQRVSEIADRTLEIEDGKIVTRVAVAE